MPWLPVISSGDVVAIHAVLIPTVNGDGEILLFGGDNHYNKANKDHQWDHTRRFNCRHPTQPLLYVQSPNVDLFCCGHAFIGDGRVMIAGGTLTFQTESTGGHQHIHLFEGHRHVFTYDPATMLINEVASMGLEPGTTKGGRWYPTLCTLPTGEVLMVGGRPVREDSEFGEIRYNNNHPERYQPLVDRWVMLSATGDDVTKADLYPRMHVLRDGSVFVSSELRGNARCIAIDPSIGTKREVCNLPDKAYRRYDCPSVLLPLTPNDDYRPRVLLCGGLTSQMIDLGEATPTWVTVPRNGTTARLGRLHACATILPTGDVLMTGGALPNNDESGVMDPELYSTPIDHVADVPTYVAGPGSWNTLNDPATVLRNYHSTALLMPDGNVWTAGGNDRKQPYKGEPTLKQKKIEIFSPPYPGGARPKITDCPRLITYGDVFEVQTPHTLHISAVTLLRCGSSTHAFNPDERCIFLSFTLADTADRLYVTAPPAGEVAPPSNYMLFLVDNAGRPCEYASFLRVGG